MTNVQHVFSPVLVDKIKEIPNDIDTSALAPGVVVKNYQEMCKLLKQDVKEGNSKLRQIEDWRRYFLWEQKKYARKYEIVKIYKNPLPRIIGEKGTYAKFMQLILLRVLLDCGSGTYYFHTNLFYEMTGMVDKEFREFVSTLYKDIDDKDMAQFEKYGIIDKDDLIDFIIIIRKKLAEITTSALNSLSASALIFYAKEYAVKVTPWEMQGGFRTATKEEEQLILDAEQKAMEEAGISNIYFGYAKEGFVKLVNKNLHSLDNSLYGSIRRIRITYHRPTEEFFNMVSDRLISSFLKDENLDENFLRDDFMLVEFTKIALNDLVIDALIDQARKVHNKAQWGKPNNMYRRGERSSHKYISDFIYFVDNAIRLKTNNRVLDYEENLFIEGDEWDLVNSKDDIALDI